MTYVNMIVSGNEHKIKTMTSRSLLRFWSRRSYRVDRIPRRPIVGQSFFSSGGDTGDDDDDDPLLQTDDGLRNFPYVPSSVEEQELLVREIASTPAPSDNNVLPISFADISRAVVAIRGGVKRTTCEKSHFLSELIGANIYFKNEFRQFTGSFKERGARNAILQLMREKKNSLKGVIAASAGNHALALAYHGGALGIPVTVVMPTLAPMAKVDKCRVRSIDLA
jgi:Pyridoxal-phosphate dependent enzyme